LKGAARIVTAKAYVLELAKSMGLAGLGSEPKAAPEGPPLSSLLAIPQTMDDVYAAADCPGCLVHNTPSLMGYRSHFAKCRGMPAGIADVFAHAMMHKHRMSAVQ
jgi:hypothetical protein